MSGLEGFTVTPIETTMFKGTFYFFFRPAVRKLKKNLVRHKIKKVWPNFLKEMLVHE